MIDEPMIGKHFGSTAAAPLFSEMVSKTLRLMAVNPDRPEDFMVTKNDKKPAKAKAQPCEDSCIERIEPRPREGAVKDKFEISQRRSRNKGEDQWLMP